MEQHKDNKHDSKRITLDYGNSKIELVQDSKDSLVLDVFEDGVFIGVICGTDIKAHCKRLGR